MKIYVSLAECDDIESVWRDEDGDASTIINPEWKWIDTEDIIRIRKFKLGYYSAEVWGFFDTFNITSGDNVTIPIIMFSNGEIYGIMEDYDSFMERLKLAPLEDIRDALRDIASSLKTDYYDETNNIADMLKDIRSSTGAISGILNEGIDVYHRR